MASLPTSLGELRQALARGERSFLGLHLDDLDGVDLDLSGCDLSGSCFREARFGHAHLGGALIEACSFQQALLWGADLSDATQLPALLADYVSPGKGVFQKLTSRNDGNSISDF